MPSEVPRRGDIPRTPEKECRSFSWRNSVIYQVYPDAFMDTRANTDGQNLFEILDKRLSYFQSLGVDALWFNPLYPSSGADGGYDITNYKAIDPKYGNIEELQDFVRRAHDEYGIRVIMDFVGSHTSTEHPWFEDAKKSKESMYHDFYVFHNPLAGGMPPNTELTEWGQPLWQYNAATNEYYLTSFSPKQADLNWRNPKVREAMGDVLRFWANDMGVDGFRLDVINFYDKDHTYYDADAPVDQGVNHRRDGEGVYDALQFMQSLVGEDSLLLGEVSVDESQYSFVPMHLMKRYVETGVNIIPQSLPEFSKREWSAASYRDFFNSLYVNLPDGSVGFSFSSHDSAQRTYSKLGKEKADQLKVMLFLQKGLVVNYYGEEIGMESQVVDVARRRDAVGRDAQRGPMEWDRAEKEQNDPHSPYALTQKLIELKHSSSALRDGVYEDILLPGLEDTIFAYKWVSNNETLLVLNNFGDMDVIGISLGEKGTMGQQLLSSKMDREEEIRDLSHLSLRPHESIVIQWRG